MNGQNKPLARGSACQLLLAAVLSVNVMANVSALTPYDAWKQQRFTSNQLANDSISGDLDQPEGPRQPR
jgi:hypothetical protein